MKTVTVLATAVLGLAACGTPNGDGGVALAPEAMPEARLAYTSPGDTRHSYTPYETRSHVRWWTGDIHIGGDWEPKERLLNIFYENGIQYSMGAVRSGEGVDRLENYAEDIDGYFRPFNVQPSLYLDDDLFEPENADILRVVWDSVIILNDALPPEFQISIDGVSYDNVASDGQIVVAVESPSAIASICGTNAVACADSWYRGSFRTRSVIYIPDDFDESRYMYSRSTVVHEFLHALGIAGHVDSIEFPDSIMGETGEFFPNLAHVIGKIDREVLQIMYMSQRSDLYNDWGEWTDVSFHIMGRTEEGHLNFGVALFNGLPHPWVRGKEPNMDLADNAVLRGTATWEGSIIGFSGPSPIIGDAELQVGLATLSDPDNEQDLRFRDIFFANRFEESDMSDTSVRWFHTRNIDYKVNVAGNTFVNVRGEGYEDGHVTGAFAGPRHEHMGGTVKRTDMVAAFGGRGRP